jgi:hypothetical protein
MVESIEFPKVRVYQEFTSAGLARVKPLMLSCSVAEAYQIETKAFAGQYLGGSTVYGYPNLVAGAVVDALETSVFVTDSVLEEFEVTDDAGVTITANSVTIDAAFTAQKKISDNRQIDTSTSVVFVDENANYFTDGVKAGDVLNLITVIGELEIPGSVVSTISDDFIVVRVENSTTLTLDHAPATAENNVEYKISRVSQGNMRVNLSFTAKRTDTGYFEFSNTQEIENGVGKITPANPLAQACALQLDHTDGLVAGYLIAEDTTAEHRLAAEALETTDVYAIAVYSKVGAAHSLWKEHARRMSDPEEGRERIVIINPEIRDYDEYQAVSITGQTEAASYVFTDAGALFITNGVPVGAILKFTVAQLYGGDAVTTMAIKEILSETTVKTVVAADATITDISYEVRSNTYVKEEKARNLYDLGKSYSFRRVIMSVPDKAQISDTVVDGGVYGAVLSGAISGNTPGQPFTEYPFGGIDRVIGSTDTFNESLLQIIAGGGGMIFYQRETGAPVQIKRQVTTDTSTLENMELSITVALDYGAKYFRAIFKNTLGRYNITDSFIRDKAYPLANGVIAYLKEKQIWGPGTSIVNITQNESSPDNLDVRVSVEVFYPNNFINIYLVV